MWELDCEESWAPKNWWFWTVVLEKTLESPLHCKEIKPVHSEGDQPWDFFGRNDAKAETPVLWPPHAKSWLTAKDSDAGRDWGQEEKGMTEDEMAGWHHWLNGRESQWTQGGLACCDSWGHKESDTTERLIWYDICDIENNARKNSFKIRGNMSGTTLLKVFFFVLFCFVCSKSFTSEYQIFLGRTMERESFEKTRWVMVQSSRGLWACKGCGWSKWQEEKICAWACWGQKVE